jgi:hypothetical protein
MLQPAPGAVAVDPVATATATEEAIQAEVARRERIAAAAEERRRKKAAAAGGGGEQRRRRNRFRRRQRRRQHQRRARPAQGLSLPHAARC